MLAALVFGQFVWLGLYLLRRSGDHWPARLTAGGLFAYAGLLASAELGVNALADRLAPAPLLLWTGAAVLLFAGRNERPVPARSRTWMLLFSVFLALGTAAILLRLDILPYALLVLAIGVDVFVLGVVIATTDAYQHGESALRDLAASGLTTIMLMLVLVAQVALLAPASPILMFTASATAALIPAVGASVERRIDRIVLRDQPDAAHDRAELRAAAAAITRKPEAIDISAIEPDEFDRLVRRALSAMTDLPKLTTSPLLDLPHVRQRLTGRDGTILERAAVLKRVLSESIERLKPLDRGSYGVSDEWRHYNVLYYPYVAGLRPYKTLPSDVADPGAADVIEWLRTQVPERTLHNWQNAAARLVARDLRDQFVNGGAPESNAAPRQARSAASSIGHRARSAR